MYFCRPLAQVAELVDLPMPAGRRAGQIGF